jgi:chromosome segregation ATPase
VEIFLRIDKALHGVSEALHAQPSENHEVERAIADLKSEIADLCLELKTSNAERMVAAAELTQVAAERNEARRELKRKEQAIEAARLREAEQTALVSSLNLELANLRSALESERQIRMGLEHSLSWQITRPVRDIMRALRTRFGQGSSVGTK